MKKCLRAFLVIAVLTSCPFSEASTAPAEGASTNSAVTVYYFHGAFRCPTCHKLEQYAKEAIETNFKDDLASGKLSFQVVNIENKGNEHYTKDYQLYTKSVVLSLLKDGKEIRFKNLDKIWQLVRNKQQYESYVRDEVAAFLKEV
ncbi:MAG: nitrophenyl compound nitroreductase subunit ArsF family protein [Candidatus Omnitrophota bacterium]